MNPDTPRAPSWPTVARTNPFLPWSPAVADPAPNSSARKLPAARPDRNPPPVSVVDEPPPPEATPEPAAPAVVDEAPPEPPAAVETKAEAAPAVEEPAEAPKPKPKPVPIPDEPIPLLRAWLANRDDARLTAAAVKLLNRIGTVTVYTTDGREEGYILSTRSFEAPQVVTPGMPSVMVPHPAPPAGVVVAQPVPSPDRLDQPLGQPAA